MRARGAAKGAAAAVAARGVGAQATDFVVDVHSGSPRRIRAGEAWRAPRRRGEGAARDVDVTADACRVAAEEGAVARGGARQTYPPSLQFRFIAMM